MIRISEDDIKMIRAYVNRIIGYCQNVPIGPIIKNAESIIEILDEAENKQALTLDSGYFMETVKASNND